MTASRSERLEGRAGGYQPAMQSVRTRAHDELFVLWSAARAEANIAYDAWCDEPGRSSYAVYRAAEDRADAAEIALIDGAAAPLAVI